MAGDWIKMRTDLQTHPKVKRIASALHADKLRAIGALHAVWCIFDTHSVDGMSLLYTPAELDAEAQCDGITGAMESVEWIVVGAQSLSLPRFDEHNGQSAKRRAVESQRKRRARISSASNADILRTREEKRREEEEEPTTLGEKPTPAEPKPRKKTATHMTTEWQPSAEWIERIRVECPSVDVMRVLPEFRDYWIGEGKPKADWSSTFANRVRTVHGDITSGNRRAIASYGRTDRRTTPAEAGAPPNPPRRTARDFGHRTAAEVMADLNRKVPPVSGGTSSGSSDPVQ